MWTVREAPAGSPDAVRLLRGYFTELTERYFRRAATEEEIDLTLEEYPTTGLAAFLVLRRDDADASGDLARPRPAGCLVEARALYVACGFSEVPPLTAPGPYKDHWYAKPLRGQTPQHCSWLCDAV